VDLLLINVAISACDLGRSYQQKSSTFGEQSISDLQLASLKALLASFLSSPYARPPYLAKGIELFTKGNTHPNRKYKSPMCHFDCKYPYKHISYIEKLIYEIVFNNESINVNLILSFYVSFYMLLNADFFFCLR
jgi:hypothetical protein